MPSEIECLVVLGSLKATEPGSDSVVAPWLDFHVIGRVRVDELDLRAVEKPVDVFGLAGIAAQEAMIAENDQVAGLSRRLVRWRRYVVRIAQTIRDVRAEQLRKFFFVEPKQPQV